MRHVTHGAATATGVATVIAACDHVFDADTSQLFPIMIPVPASMKHAKLVFNYSQPSADSDEPQVDEDSQVVRFPQKHQAAEMQDTSSIATERAPTGSTNPGTPPTPTPTKTS